MAASQKRRRPEGSAGAAPSARRARKAASESAAATAAAGGALPGGRPEGAEAEPAGRPQPHDEEARSLYDVLGVGRGATTAEITKAFKKRALQVHPDKKRASAAAQGTKNEREQFQMLSEAYQVLKDPKKRRDYDMYGTLNEEDLDAELFARWSGKFCQTVDMGSIDEYLAGYYGSPEELEDMRRIVVEGKGLLKLFEYLVGSKAADCERYLLRVKQELKVAVSEKEEAAFRKKAAAWQKREGREAEGGKRQVGKRPAAKAGEGGRASSGLDALAAQIRRRSARSDINPQGALAAALRAAASDAAGAAEAPGGSASGLSGVA